MSAGIEDSVILPRRESVQRARDDVKTVLYCSTQFRKL
jgi:hypothetical protein